MTKRRYDEHSTEFGLWLRNKAPDNVTILRIPDPIDSELGFITTNLDYIWGNYETDKWMLMEEKRHGGSIEFYQQGLFNKIDKLCQQDNLYYGFHKLVFENTNPEDGKMWLDEQPITKEQLLDFLRFVL